ncbi:MAG: hypothetical protein CMP61_06120 [Flavobacteriales bacterium]|nr:hypothetical protein [Flavobacteriales bacterium]|tara:strand:- start:53542 stop:54051 length:510 start_codon:yes stop_codon:yes gene_type:complete
MTVKQHIKGVLVAIVSATLILFVISFFAGSEVRVNKTYVINASADSVYAFIKSPKNFKKFIEGGDAFEIDYLPDSKGVQYEGFDGNLHQFKYACFDNAKGLELSYFKEGENMALYKMKAKSKEKATLIEYEIIWRIGVNPLSKILSLAADEDIEAGMKKDIANLKKELE